MGANLEITKKLQNYIDDFGLKLHPVQQEIIDYNNTLGDIKRMQVDPSQCHFLHLIIKISNIKNVLEIGTFTGLSALSILLALPDDGKLTALDKNEETNKVVDGDKDPQIIVEEKGLKQESDPKALEALIDKIINDNREKAIEYKNGKEKLFGFFVGQAMKVSGGKANPQLINEILKKKL